MAPVDGCLLVSFALEAKKSPSSSVDLREATESWLQYGPLASSSYALFSPAPFVQILFSFEPEAVAAAAEGL